MISFLLNFFCLAKVLDVCMYFFFVCGLCVCVVLLLDICAFFSRPDLEAKILQGGLSFNFVHKQH